MRKLKGKGLKWLKGFHLIAVSCWIGGAVALILLYFLKDDYNIYFHLQTVENKKNEIELGYVRFVCRGKMAHATERAQIEKADTLGEIERRINDLEVRINNAAQALGKKNEVKVGHERP